MRINVLPVKPAFPTHEGAPARHIDVVSQLRRSVMANMLFEDTFYEDGVDIAKRIEAEVAAVLKEKSGAGIIAATAEDARTRYKLRHVPLLLLATLIKANTPATRAAVADAIASTIQRPDELGELVAMYWKVNGGRKMLPAQVKKGLERAFQKFNEYSLAKYNSDNSAVKLRDVLFLSHARPLDVEQAAIWKRLVEGKLQTPDTWETQLSAGADKAATFTRLIKEGKLGALALLRNLRNMIQAGVDEKLIRGALITMKPERVLPFRFITAARYAPQFEPELEHAMFGCLQDVPKLPGKTVVLVDNSGSMAYPVSGKSELTRSDAARALAMLIREIAEEPFVISFANNPTAVPPRRGFALRDAINATPSGGTWLGRAVASANGLDYDRLIVITDEQSSDPVPNPTGRGYMINVAAYRNGVGYGSWVHIDGWSEAVVDYIQEYEREG